MHISEPSIYNLHLKDTIYEYQNLAILEGTTQNDKINTRK